MPSCFFPVFQGPELWFSYLYSKCLSTELATCLIFKFLCGCACAQGWYWNVFLYSSFNFSRQSLLLNLELTNSLSFFSFCSYNINTWVKAAWGRNLPLDGKSYCGECRVKFLGWWIIESYMGQVAFICFMMWYHRRTQHSLWNFVSKNPNPRTREMTQWLRTLDALAEDLGLVFSFHKGHVTVNGLELQFQIPALVSDSSLLCRCHACVHTHILYKIKEIKAEPYAHWREWGSKYCWLSLQPCSGLRVLTPSPNLSFV